MHTKLKNMLVVPRQATYMFGLSAQWAKFQAY